MNDQRDFYDTKMELQFTPEKKDKKEDKSDNKNKNGKKG